MDFAIGDIFSLKAAVYDMNKIDRNDKNPPDSAILYWPGTQVHLVKIDKNHIHLQFPNGEVEPHDPAQVLYFYNRIIDNKLVTTKISSGFGTPPESLTPFLPEGTDWRRNYRYRITLELEDRGEKQAICPTSGCYNDLGNIPKNNEGLQFCSKCDRLVLSVNPKMMGANTDNERTEHESGPIS